MAPPRWDIRVDWDRDGWGSAGTIDDITSDVLSMRRNYGHMDSFGNEIPTNLTLTVDNGSGKYNDLLGSSPLAGKLKPRRPIHVVSYGGASVPWFDGRIDNIIPIDDPGDPKAEIVCSDATQAARRRDIEIVRDSRSLGNAYAVVAAEIQIALSMNDIIDMLSDHGIEEWSYAGNGWEALRLLHGVSGARHFLQFLGTEPIATPCQIVVRERMYPFALTGTSYTRGTDFERMTEWAGADRFLINEQLAKAQTLRASGASAVLWEYTGPNIELGIGETFTLQITVGDVADEEPVVTLEGTDVTGAVEYFGRNYIEVAVSGVPTGILTGATVTARPGSTQTTSTRKIDSASQAAYDRVDGPELASGWWTPAQAKGLADYYVWRYKNAPRTAKLICENREDAIARMPLDVLQVTDPVLGLTNWRCEILSIESVVDNVGESWHDTLLVQELPAVQNFFDIGTDSIGGAAILGY